MQSQEISVCIIIGIIIIILAIVIISLYVFQLNRK